MLNRLMPLFRHRRPKGDQQQRTSLVVIVLVTLLLTSLVPVLLIGTLSVFRQRATMESQINDQMASIVRNNEAAIQQILAGRESIADQLVSNTLFRSYLITMAQSQLTSPEFIQAHSTAFTQLKIYFDFRAYQLQGANSGTEDIMILRPDGQLLIETTAQNTLIYFGKEKVDHPFILSLMGTNGSYLTYNTTPVAKDTIIYYVTRALKDDQGKTFAEMILFGSNFGLTKALTDSGAFYKNSNPFFYTGDGAMIGLGAPEGNNTPYRTIPSPTDNALIPGLKTSVQSPNNEFFFSATTRDGNPVVVFTRWMPEYKMGMGLAVPQIVAFGQNGLLDPFNILVLIVSLVITGSLIYFGTTRLVNPLVQLSSAVERFSKGNWSERTNIQRGDEIGLLANSFNHMADELSDMYRSLETVVERRTSQIRTASEVAQLATSTGNMGETLARMVDLISERFGFYHVALYLVDETGHTLILSEAAGTASENIKKHADRLEIITHSLPGWVALNKMPRVISNVQQDELYHPNPFLPDTLSEVGLPVTIGNEVLGVLDIQSTLENAFDEEMVEVLLTLANQISSTLQNSRLLETTQVSYQETSLLYRATRQVTQASGESEIIQILTDTFIQLPYVALVLTAQEDQFKVMVVTDSKTGRIDRNLVNITIPMRNMAPLLLTDRFQVIDISKPSEFDSILSFLYRRGCKIAALLTIVEAGELSKVIALGSREAEHITHTTLQPYTNLVEVVGTSLEKFQLLHSLQYRLNELQALNSFSKAISIGAELTQLCQSLLMQVKETLGEDTNFAVALYNHKTNLIEIPFRYEDGQMMEPLQPFPLGQGMTSFIILNRTPLLLVKDAEKRAKELGAIVQGLPAKSWMGIPLLFSNEVVGALIMQDTEKEERYTETDLNLFTTLAPQIATAFRNAELLEETQQALQAYSQEHFLLNSLLENSPDGIYFKDPQGKFIRASKSLADLYRVPLDDIPGKTDFELLEDQTLAANLWDVQKEILESRMPNTEIYQQLVPYTGKEFWWQLSGVPIFEKPGDADPYGLLLIQRNITDMKQAEALAQRRAEQVLTASEIARDSSGTLEVASLLQKSVNLVRERFGFYHSSIFLLDELAEYAVLRESTGSAGEQMVKNGHRLSVGSKSIVGQATSTGKPLIVNDVTKDPNYYPNPLLPYTHSELAIPLKVNERILGALDVQSQKANAFNEEDVNVLTILADQLAVALVNAELFAKTQELLGKHRLLRQISIAASTSTTLEEAIVSVVKGLRSADVADRVSIMMLDQDGYLHTQASAGYEGTRHLEVRVKPGEGITGAAAAEKTPIRVDNTQADPRYIILDPQIHSELAIPILFSDELMGVLNLESTNVSAFDENDLEILGALGNNLGGVIANVRLVQQVRQQVERERLLFEVTSKIRHSVDLETIVETSTREICRALGARRAHIQITAGRVLPKETANETEINQAAFPPLNKPEINRARKNGKGLNGSGSNGKEAEE